MNDKWCLCRWTSAYTSMLLEHRDEKAGAVVRRESLHAERLVSMCGPLSAREPGWADDSSIEIHLGDYGFIDGGIGNVATWPTMEEAQAVVSAGRCGEQDWIKVDKAAPLFACFMGGCGQDPCGSDGCGATILNARTCPVEGSCMP